MKELRGLRRLRFLTITLALVFLAAVVITMVMAHRLRPVAREKVIELLEERFDDVQLEDLDVRTMPGMGLIPRIAATGKGLSLGLRGREDAPPFITMGRFSVDVDLLGLVRRPIRIRKLTLDELQIQIPPGGEEPVGEEKDGPDSEAGHEIPPVFLIDHLIADGAVLRILPEDPEKQPLQFDLHQLSVESVGVDQPMVFESLLDNAKPPGEIETRGKFGPLQLRKPGTTPVSGSYVFKEANLSVFKGIAGTLYSEGEFTGALGRIEVRGLTDTPDFQLKSAGNPVHLKTDFHTIVDGTNGDTLLQPIDAQLENSRFRAEGGVVGTTGTDGKTVSLDAKTVEGRVEDFLRLAVKSKEPFMTGGIQFASTIVIPPGDVEVVKKLELDGRFKIQSARFADPKVRDKIDDLSRFGKGKKDSSDRSEADAERSLSNVSGRFQLQDGVMTLTDLSFAVPGAEVRFEGTFGLVTEEVDFLGELRLEAKLSETTTGFKSILLKAIDPLFEKKGAGAVIPIKITGTMSDPSFGVDISRVFAR